MHNSIAVHNGTMTSLERSLPLDHHVCFAMYNGIHNMQRVYRPWLEEWGITYPQYLVLVAMWRCGDPGAPGGILTVKELGEQLHLDSGTLSPLLKRMEAAGLLRRTRSEEDNRRVAVQLLEPGWDLQQSAIRMQQEVAHALDLTVHEAETVMDVARRVALLAEHPSGDR